MKIVISSGHSKKVRGAAGSPRPPYLEEVDEARRVTEAVATKLRSVGVDVTTFHDDVSSSQSENLTRICDFHNSKTRDYDFSVHFNAYEQTSKPMGCEVLYLSQQALADKIVDAICDASGLINRGPKKRTDLKFLNSTEAPACLLEICFVDSSADADIYRAKFDGICAAIAEAISGQEIQPGPTPPTEPVRPPIRPPVRPPTEPDEGEHPTIKKGDNNEAVAELQEALGVLIADGDFGQITHNWVKGFQAACGLSADGVVGPKTWDAVDDLNSRVAMGSPRLPKRLEQQIVQMAEKSEIQEFLWPDRGMSPPGMVAGLALSYAYAIRQFGDGDDAATVMAKAVGNPDKDALAWLAPEFKKIGLVNTTTDQCLRSLFVLFIGLAMRESSGRYVEGRDLSASNVQSETCEASLVQTSWNIKAFSSAIEPLLDEFWQNPNDFRDVFKLDVNPTADNLSCYGSGDGARYQWLSRFCPLFHIMVSGIGLRTGKDHWGPVKRKEVTLKKEADDLLKEVKRLVDAVA